ncbi:cobalt transporter CbiM [Martelella radicis]|uniref:Cobalt/nickel transport system permease protein n=1 Tax=Martelella radicis TaxID=1397476 RepID=A0A7W6KHU2_9HYPH|nr:cobalt transporter CbiM [Martelella radicis]MBB4120248.1 cobalt/nickel transport system permease protein [Martelella radicis]
MAHIPDGLLSLPVLIGGGAVAAAGVAAGLKSIDDRAIPRVAVLSAAFFAASLIAVPVGPSSVHVLLSALTALMLGPAIFPAVLVALLLQTVLFGFGGLTTLGVNTVNIALPGYLVALIIGKALRRAPSAGRAAMIASLGASVAVFLTGGLVALCLWLSSSAYVPAARILLLTYLPLALGEALVCGAIVGFLKRVAPELLEPRLPERELQT